MLVVSTSVTVPLIATASSSAAFITSSARSSVVVALVSLVKAVLLTASFPALSKTLTLTSISPSARALISLGFICQLPSLSTSTVVVTRLIPSLNVMVTSRVASTSVTVPLITTLLCSAAFTTSSDVATATVVLASLSCSAVSLLVAVFPAISVTLAVAVNVPSLSADKSALVIV